MSVSGRGLFTDAFKDLLFDVVFVETPHAGNIGKIKSVIDSCENEIAAFIYEPLLQAAGGMRMYKAVYMDELLTYIKSKEILCIADEVMTGFGRTGSLFAGERLACAPDITCLSKGVTGGSMALGVTACSQLVFDAFLSEDRTKTFFHGHSYTANPLACTAGLASLDLLLEKKCGDQIKTIQSQHEYFVENDLSKNYAGIFRNIRIMGTILAFELNTGKDEYINRIGPSIMQWALKEGIYLRPLGNTVYLMPPYCISPEQLRKIYEFILSVPERFKAGRIL
jgi:adenosylmethionine-8-amino-7-oxononanoate aminotransferase